MSEVSFHYGMIVFLLFSKQKRTYCSLDMLFVNVKFPIFYFLCCKGVFSRGKRNERLSGVARELLASLLILCFYNVFK